MTRQKQKPSWLLRRSERAEQKPSAPVPPAPAAEVEHPIERTGGGAAASTCPASQNYCDKTIRITRRAYLLAHQIRASAQEKASSGLSLDFRVELGLGKMVEVALKEFAEKRGLL